ncbi:MAG: hypothetical protein ACK56F_00715 [bacterium]
MALSPLTSSTAADEAIAGTSSVRSSRSRLSLQALSSTPFTETQALLEDLRLLSTSTLLQTLVRALSSTQRPHQRPTSAKTIQHSLLKSTRHSPSEDSL